MTDPTALQRFLPTDARDVGCDEALQILHVYVELVAAGNRAHEWYPAWRHTFGRVSRAALTSTGCSPLYGESAV